MRRFRSSAPTANPDIPSFQCLLLYDLLLVAMGHYKGIIPCHSPHLFTVDYGVWQTWKPPRGRRQQQARNGRCELAEQDTSSI
jgi:hypothetical protein